MPDQEFKIVITSTADNKGFEQASEGAKKLTAAEAAVVDVSGNELKKAYQKAEDAAAVSMEHLASASRLLTQATTESNDALKTRGQYQDEEIKKEEAVALARVRAALAIGAITEAQAAQQERDIKGRGNRQTDQADHDTAQGEIDNLNQELQRQKGIAAGITNQRTNNPPKLEEAKAAEDITKKLMDYAISDRDKHAKFLEEHGSEMSMHDWEQAQRLQKGLVRRAGDAEDAYNAAHEHAEGVRKAAEKMQKDFDEASQRITELTRQVQEKTEALGAADAHRNTMRGLNDSESSANEISRVAGTAGGKEETAAEQLATALRNHQQLTAQQWQMLLKAYRDATGQNATNANQILNLFDARQQTDDAILKRIADIERRLHATGAAAATGRN